MITYPYSTSRLGALTHIRCIGPDGKRIDPVTSHRSASGMSGTDFYADSALRGALILRHNFSNTGIDRSTVEKFPENMTPAQADALRKFRLEHLASRAMDPSDII